MAVHSSLRASDADRDAVAERLRKAAAEGRLEPDELEERLDAALRARTYGELDRLLVDLPAGQLRARQPSRLATGARMAVAFTVPLLVAVVALAAIAVVAAVAVAGWMVWMIIGLLVCSGRHSARRRHHTAMRRTRPAGLL